jgi:lactate permease
MSRPAAAWGKIMDAQSIVVANTAAEQYGHEGDTLRYYSWHSTARLIGILVFQQAYVSPFPKLVAWP